MCPEGLPPHVPRRWSLRSSWGELAFASTVVALVSGAALAVTYDVERPYDSIALALLTNPAAAFCRNVHYWAGQAFLVLTLAHVWDHLSRWTETRVRRSVWWRTALSLPLGVFVMLSGFMLKGDSEAQQALRIVTSCLEQVPWVGRLVCSAVFGTEGHRQILYVHHVASASMLIWMTIAEHARAVWPRLVAVVETLAPVALISLFVSPALHDGLDPVVKGPWYFLGVQEALHWTRWPLWLVGAGGLLVVVLVRLPRLLERRARAAKTALALTLILYSGLTAVGVFLPGENWSLVPVMTSAARSGGAPWSGLRLHGLGPWFAPPMDAVLARGIPVVLGRREGCLFCHGGMRGLSPSHREDAVGCASCHAGNPFSLDAATAHDGLVLVPGNLASAARTCGTPQCHPSQVEWVSRSLMATMGGIVAVDRVVFGERPDRGRSPDVGRLGRSGPDSHLRQLCASCHLGASKTVLGPIREDERGGGCNACHLKYAGDKATGPARQAGTLPRTHPDVSMAVERRSCFGCHSRSGRISTSYEGWSEGAGRPSGRRLADGRLFTFVAPDVHARSMDCVDCHAAREVMGDGEGRVRQYEAIRVACEDCHRSPGQGGAGGGVVSVPVEGLDAESRRIADLTGRGKPGERFLTTARGGDPLMNTGVDAHGVPWLAAKRSSRQLPLKSPAAVCIEGAGHARLSCINCHEAWAPRCPQCHTAFDPRITAIDLLDGRTTQGAWIETAGEFRAAPPTLGVRIVPGGMAGRDVIDTFIPSMVMTLDRNQTAGAKPDIVFRRLYARAFSHTIGKSARSCRSCHADPVALGYGEGTLSYGREGDRRRWHFVPRFPPGPDGLPADAWTGFLQKRATGTSTRADVRPLSVEKQKRILTVGACLTCHEPSRVPVSDFRGALGRVTAKCLLPAW